ncbi:hypothetical protein ACQ4LE_000995 [Meloidogyne hapla]
MMVKINEKSEKQKVWGAIFVCALARTIHLELVTEASAEKFLLAFTRFCRRWRVPKRIISDNGTNFVLGSKAIKQLSKENYEIKKKWLEIYQDPKIKSHSTQNQIEWTFITLYAPWKGALYERMIRSVKHHLKREIRNKLLSFEELWTLLIEVERIVNERPMSYISDAENITPLRPINLAIPCLKSQNLDINPREFDKDDSTYFENDNRELLIQKYSQALNISQKFWETWKNTYLLNLWEKYNNCRTEKSGKFPEINEVVIVEEVNAPRSSWRLGKIQKLISSRTAIIKIGNKEYERAIKHLYPLEITNKTSQNNNQVKDNIQNDINQTNKNSQNNNQVKDNIQNDINQTNKNSQNNHNKINNIDQSKNTDIDNQTNINNQTNNKNIDKSSLEKLNYTIVSGIMDSEFVPDYEEDAVSLEEYEEEEEEKEEEKQKLK